MKQLILASSSPRRKSLLEREKIPFVIDVSDIPEPMDMNLSPHELSIKLSREKAAVVAARHRNAIVLAADTFVVLEGKYLGKPKSREDALAMLLFQSGKMQEVVTGFTLLDTDTKKVFSDASIAKVYMKRVSATEINAYLDQNTYSDKAGAYAIQEVGETFVEKIEGDYDTIVGLPVKEVVKKLKEF
ncbi:MAG TPA: nucleoside triphosphate pyrophosphatase [Candidatus Saccharimonadales bacterium]|nr:nucleoside triphosphate pyrophosphatase [Candidatus Saccharimonadales bacterium]